MAPQQERPPVQRESKERIFQKHPRIALLIVFSTLLLISLTVIDLVCQLLLSNHIIRGRSYDLLINLKTTKLNPNAKCDQSFLDPLLGYAHSNCDRFNIEQIPSFVTYGPAEAPLRVVTLGGSTTDPIIMGEKSEIGPDNWPKLFSELCTQTGTPCRVFNGGSGAFTSSQELLKLIRDVRPLQPQVVISLNGINEHYFFDPPAAQYPYTSTYQQYFFRAIATTGEVARYNDARHPENERFRGGLLNRLIPNTRQVFLSLRNQTLPSEQPTEFVGPVNFGTASTLPPWEIWENNVQMMHAISQQMGAKYYVFLQPTMGIGNYNYDNPRDAEMRAKKDENYYAQMNQLYNEIRPRCAKLDYCFDMSNAFDGQSELYRDPRHPNGKGNQIQAKVIFQRVFAGPRPTESQPKTP